MSPLLQPLAQHRPPGIDVLRDQSIHIVTLPRQPRHDVQPPRFFVVPQRLQRIVLTLQPRPRALGDFAPGAVNQPGSRQFSFHLQLVRAVEYWRDRTEAQAIDGPSQVRLEDLPDVHPPWHTEWVQYHVNGSAVGQERHVFNRQHFGDDPLVPVAASHLVTLFDLPQLCHADADHLFHTHLQVAMLLAVEDFDVHDLAALAVGQA